ncbi:MAG: TAXI family TRAP transporter solute-binding subunit, partial [Xanthobacteraceae bacterium]
MHPTDGPLDNLRLIKDQSSGVDVALLFGGLTNSEQSPGLISLGRIAFAPIWIFYRGTETLERLTQLKGKRIAVPAATRVVLEQILAAHGVNSDNTTMLPLASPAAAKAFKDGEVDVFVLIIELNAPLVQALLRDPTVRLMSVTQAEALARVYPFLTRLVLPQGVIDFERNIPTNDVSLIADTQAVLVRKNLHPELIYLLAQALSEEHGRAGIFQRAGDFPTVTDPEFPVAQDALDFYKNGPSFLDRYLPFWMTSYA